MARKRNRKKKMKEEKEKQIINEKEEKLDIRYHSDAQCKCSSTRIMPDAVQNRSHANACKKLFHGKCHFVEYDHFSLSLSLFHFI